MFYPIQTHRHTDTSSHENNLKHHIKLCHACFLSYYWCDLQKLDRSTLARERHEQSVEKVHGSAWKLHGPRGCGGPIDGQFSILDPGFSSLDGYQKLPTIRERALRLRWL